MRKDERTEYKESRRKRRRQIKRKLLLLCLAVMFSASAIWLAGKKAVDWIRLEQLEAQKNASFVGAPPFEVQLLEPNPYSRPGTPLQQIRGIVIHYTANPGSTAQDNRNYFNGLKDSHETKVSSHFVVGIEGEIVQCIPSTEIAYASNSRNEDTLSIECCHRDETGKFTEETYLSLVRLTGWLCQRFGLESSDVIRHYDVTGKICPKYYVDYPEEWEKFRKDVDLQKKEVEQEIKAQKGE